MYKYWLYLSLVFSMSLYSAKKGKPADNDIKRNADKKVSIASTSQTHMIPYEETLSGQIANLHSLPEFEKRGYAQVNLITNKVRAQEKLDAISDILLNNFQEMRNDKVSVATRFQATSNILHGLSEVFSRIIPKKDWDVYLAQKYNIVAHEFNRYLKEPEIIKQHIKDLGDDIENFMKDLLLAAQTYLNQV